MASVTITSNIQNGVVISATVTSGPVVTGVVSTGAQGPVGPQGPAGADGATGPQGIQGIQGPIGSTGPEGPIGLKGDTGNTGPIGNTGPAGTNGTNGTNGADGLTVSVNSVTQVAGDISLTQDNIPDGTTNKAYTATEQTKLSGIEALADVTDATNVAAAGAIMDGDITGNGLVTRTGAGAYTNRTITGTSNQVTVTNGNGVSGNPTLSLPSAITTPGSLTITGNNSPQADSTYTLGTSALYWSNTYTDRLYLNSTAYLDGGTAGAIGITGLVGIGTTSPGAKLQVDTGAAGTIGQIIEGAASQTADLLQLQNSSGTVLSKFTSAGNLLLPGGSSGAPSLSFTSDPNSGFYSLATNYFGVSAGGSLVATYQNNSGRKGTLLYGNTYSGTVANAVLTLSTDSSILATHSIDQTNKKYLIQPYESGVSYNVDTILNSLGGNVGIGTTTPDSIFTLDGPSNVIGNDYGTFTIRNNSDTNKHLSMGIDTSIGTWGSAYIKAVRTTSAAMPLLLQPSGGVVGITTGSDTIGARFQVNTGAAATIGQIIKGASAQTADLLQLQDSSANKLMVVSSGGNVGIGTTSPSEKLEISGTVKATGYKSSDGSAGVSGSFTTTDGKTITIKDGLVVSIV